MSEPLDPSTIEPHLRRVMNDCRKLYVASGKMMVRRHPTLLDDAAGFIGQMEDLHAGLLVKVYTTTIRSDGKWTRMEKYVASLMIEHIWDEHLRGVELREASEGLLTQADHLRWPALVGPFVRYEPLRDMIGQLETVVMRWANLIVKCDGLTTPEETLTLHDIQRELDRALKRPEPTGLDAGQAVAIPGAKRGQVRAETTVVSHPTKSADERLAEALAELDALVGLEGVKERVRSLSNFLQLQRQRQSAGLTTMPISLHMSFVGNPGTGKTTVGRIVGQILGAMGILSSGHLVETDRGGLVAQYSGQTAMKTAALCDSARGGVLFIDEAYSLIDASGDDPFGREAIQTLVRRMEDDRGQMAVILAGYPTEMDAMIRCNPGLSSRINTRIHFDDYTPIDMGRIFESLCKRNDYHLPAESRHRLLVALTETYRDRDLHFGNGRLARNAFEDSVRRLADRIAGVMPLTAELMTRLTARDVVIPGYGPDEIDRLMARPHVLRIGCPKCGRRLRVRGEVLGRSVRCPACEQTFAAEWADVEYPENASA